MFIINSLFNAISGIGMSCSSSLNPHVGTQEEQEIKVWFQAYRDMVSVDEMGGDWLKWEELGQCGDSA